MFSLRLCGKKKRNDPRPGSKIQRPLPGLYSSKTGKQHRVHTKAEPICLLNDLQSISLKIVQTLIFL